MDARRAAGSRFDRASGRGHYESWFVRANHPARPLAFWSRYTVFAPSGRPSAATGEVWGIWFDGERNEVFAAREDVPLRESSLEKRGLDVRLGRSRVTNACALGSAELATGGERVAWNLTMHGGDGPLLFLPESLYRTPFPTAKSVILARDIRFDGTFEAGGSVHQVDGWLGSVNHNWGSRHTDEYAWCQVVGFDDAAGTFLECITGRVVLSPRIGLHSPWITIAVLHVDGRMHRLASLHEGLSRTAPYEVGAWSFVAHGRGVSMMGEIRAPKDHFVGLGYRNPSGGTKLCHNTKIASATVCVREHGHARTLSSENRVAFEVLSDVAAPGVSVVA